MIRLIAILCAMLLSLPSFAGDTPMSQLFKIGERVTLAHVLQQTQPGSFCAKAAIPKDDSTRISQLLATVDTVGLKDELGYSPAYYAVMVDDTRQLKRLLNLGYSTSGPLGSLLNAAAYWDSVGSTRVLLRRGVDPNTPHNAGGTPLQVAVGQGGPDVARVLLKHGALPTTRDLWAALACKSQDMVNLLVQAGVPVDANARNWARKYNIRLQ